MRRRCRRPVSGYRQQLERRLPAVVSVLVFGELYALAGTLGARLRAGERRGVRRGGGIGCVGWLGGGNRSRARRRRACGRAAGGVAFPGLVPVLGLIGGRPGATAQMVLLTNMKPRIDAGPCGGRRNKGAFEAGPR